MVSLTVQSGDLAIAVLLVVPYVKGVPIKFRLELSSFESKLHRLLSAELHFELVRLDALVEGVEGRLNCG